MIDHRGGHHQPSLGTLNAKRVFLKISNPLFSPLLAISALGAVSALLVGIFKRRRQSVSFFLLCIFLAFFAISIPILR